MKKNIACTILSLIIFLYMPSSAQNAGNESSKNSRKWFNEKKWLNGTQLKPHPSINKEEFARQYKVNKAYWDKAFAFLKQHDLDSLPKGKYIIDGDNVYATVTEDATKDFEKTGWESHRKFIDLQCIISGQEKMGISPVKEAVVTNAYDDKKDLANYTAAGKFYIAGARTFFLFFPSDAHRPNITPGGNKVEKKIVVKIRAAEPNQQQELVQVVKEGTENKINIFIGDKLFTSFLYPDTLEKPVLYPVYAANGTIVTRGFPLNPQPGDPNDHPHHIGIWFNFENVNGLDFWNNSYAIPKEKKSQYGWIKTDRIVETSGGKKGILSYHANWTNQKNEVLLEETTRFEFSGTNHQRIVDRYTVLKAGTDALFTDAKDGLLGIRLAHQLQIPTDKDQKFTDDKGNVTIVKGGSDTIANGNYISSEGKQGDDVWSTRGRWCKVYGRMGNDSISVVIIDHPENPNYPTFWHARGYGLFAANPLGEKIFTNDKSFKNLQLKKGGKVSFRYRIIIDEGSNTISDKQLNALADEFAASK